MTEWVRSVKPSARVLNRVSVAFPNRLGEGRSLSGSLSRFLSSRLIPAGAFKGWCAVRTLQTVFFKQALRRAMNSLELNPRHREI